MTGKSRKGIPLPDSIFIVNWKEGLKILRTAPSQRGQTADVSSMNWSHNDNLCQFLKMLYVNVADNG
jgi:hypothetical protein